MKLICNKYLLNERGTALVLAVFMVAMLTIMTFAMLEINLFESKSAAVNVQMPQYRAVSALNKIIWEIKKNPNKYLNEGDYDIVVEGYGTVEFHVAPRITGGPSAVAQPKDEREIIIYPEGSNELQLKATLKYLENPPGYLMKVKEYQLDY